MKKGKARRNVQLAVVLGSVFVLLGSGLWRPEPPEPPTVLPGVVVRPPAEALERLAAEEERRALIATAVAHYGIERPLAERIHDAADAEAVDPRLAFALVRVESHFDPDAVSSAGALGLTQLLPSTARGLSPEVERDALFDAETNLRLGIRYLRGLLDRYEGDRRLALTAYNRGPGTVARARAAGEEPYNGYARRVLDHRVRLVEEGGAPAGTSPAE